MKINNKAKNLTILTFLLALTLAPAIGFAKENENRDRDDDKNKCVKAWGQFVKNGWKENKGNISISSDCRIPNGIFKKWNYNRATSTDIVAPTINSFTVAVRSTKAEFDWMTNEKTRGVLFYGTTTPVVVKATSTNNVNLLKSVSSTNSSVAVDNIGLRAKGELNIKNLLPNTTYYAVLAVRDNSGNVTISNSISFTTTVSTSTDTTAPTISNILTTINLNKLFINWKTNEPARSKLFYGTTTVDVAATTTANISKTTLGTNHSFELPSMSSTTPYHVILQSTDAVGNVKTSGEYVIYSPF